MTEELKAKRDTSGLPPEESYVVTQLRKTGGPLRFNRDNRPYLCVGSESVCTFDTLFRLLGRGIIELDPTATQMDRYELTPDWR